MELLSPCPVFEDGRSEKIVVAPRTALTHVGCLTQTLWCLMNVLLVACGALAALLVLAACALIGEQVGVLLLEPSQTDGVKSRSDAERGEAEARTPTSTNNDPCEFSQKRNGVLPTNNLVDVCGDENGRGHRCSFVSPPEWTQSQWTRAWKAPNRTLATDYAADCTRATGPAQQLFAAPGYTNSSRRQALHALRDQTVVFFGDSTARRLAFVMCTFLEGEFRKWYHARTSYGPMWCPSETLRAHSIGIVYIGGQNLEMLAGWLRAPARDRSWIAEATHKIGTPAAPCRALQVILQLGGHDHFPTAYGHALRNFQFLGFRSEAEWMSGTAHDHDRGARWRRAEGLLNTREATSDTVYPIMVRGNRSRWQEPEFNRSVRGRLRRRLAQDMVQDVCESAMWKWERHAAHHLPAQFYILTPPLVDGGARLPRTVTADSGQRVGSESSDYKTPTAAWNSWALALGAAAGGLAHDKRRRRCRVIDQARLMAEGPNSTRRHRCFRSDGWVGLHTESTYAQVMRVQLVLHALLRPVEKIVTE